MRSEESHTKFLAAYEAYADALFRFCYGKTSSRDEAKDLAQETFLRAWREVERGNEIRDFKAFLYTVARNLIKDYYKRKKPVLERDLPEGILEEAPVAATQNVSAEARLFGDVIRAQKEPYRESLILHLIEGLPIHEIAELLQERPNTISVRVKRGIEKVRIALHIDHHD
ncbi:MAG: RNA polymerase sigma factor [Minisyncoccia bacterium]